MESKASQDLLAYLYDRTHQAYAADTSLYGDLATRTGGPVLELGCGTGRLLEGLVAAGIAVFGIDVDASMLQRARHRLGASPLVRLIQGDMRQVTLPSPCGLVMLARSALGYVHDWDALAPLLSRIGQCLAPNGCLVIDQVNLAGPAAGEAAQGNEPEIWWDPLLNARIRTQSIQRADKAGGFVAIRDHYIVERMGCEPEQLTNATAIRAYGLGQLVSALESADLRVQGVYGDYRLGPYRPNSERLLVLAGRCG